MRQSLAYATIVDRTGAHDYTVAEGTTVAGLMATIEVDLSDRSLNMTTSDGTAVDAGAIIGRDLPSGVVIAFSGQMESRRIATRAARLNEFPWLRPVLVDIVFLSSLVVAEGAALILPIIGFWTPPVAARWITAVICVISCAAAITRVRVRDQPWLVLSLSALFGATAAALVPLDAEFAMTATLLTMLWWALIGSLAAWAIYDFTLGALTARIWAAAVFAASLSAYLEIDFVSAAPLLLTFAVLLTAFTPSLAIRVPETQLLDLPVVATTAGSLRRPEPSAPSKITMRRVLRTIEDGRVRAQTLLLVCTATVLLSAPSVVQLMDHRTWEGRAAIALVICSWITLLIAGRNRRERSARILPRIAAIVLLVSALTSAPLTSLFGMRMCAIALLVLGGAHLVSALVSVAHEPTALVSRILDILESLSLVILLPAAVYTAGAFDFIRQVAS